MQQNYILIDFENVQPDPSDIALLNQEHFMLKVFVGAQQTKIAIQLVQAVQTLGSRAEYIRIMETGADALDFHIAFYAGQLSLQDPDAFVHIITKDTGFDPLIKHLRERKIRVSRFPAIKHIPGLRPQVAVSLADRLQIVQNDLKRRKDGRPATIKTLSSTINALFGKNLSEFEIASIVQALQQQQMITIDNTRIVYRLTGS
jgi:hypothetical protein